MEIDYFECEVIRHETETEWVEARKQGIGASETAALFGVGYVGASPLTVWASKTGGPVEEHSEATLLLFERGHLMEPVISRLFEIETGWKTIDPGNYTIFRSATDGHLFATLDRIVVCEEYGAIPLELKNVSGRLWRDWEDGLTPLKFEIQCQHQMAVTGAPACYLAALIGGDDLQVRLILRNDRFIDVMRSKIAEFWELCKDKTLPPIDDSEATGKLLQRIWPKDSGEDIELPGDAAQWDEELSEIKLESKKLNDRETAVENKIKAAIGEATAGLLPGGGKYTWKMQERAGFVVQPTSFRVLRRVGK